MLVYLVAFLVTLIPVIRFDLMRIDGDRKVWAYCELALLILIAGLRYRVGGDTLIYMDMFETYPTIDELSTFDFETAKYNPLWYIYNSVFKTFGDSFTFFQIVQAIIVNVCFFRFFRRYSPKAFFTCVFVYYVGYYCYFNMEVLREALCICVLFEAYPFLEKRKFIPYFLLSAFAMCIHMSAVIMFLLPLMLFIRHDRFWLAIIIVIGTIVMLRVVDIVSLILYSTLEGKTADGLRLYMMLQSPNIIGMMVQFLKVVPFIILIYLRNRYNYRNDALMAAMLLPLIGFQTGAMFITMISRFSNYFYIFGLVVLINTFYEHYWSIHKHLFARLLVMGIFMTYGVSLSYFYLMNRDEDLKGSHVYNRYLPYESVFSPQINKTREMLLQNERAQEVEL